MNAKKTVRTCLIAGLVCSTVGAILAYGWQPVHSRNEPASSVRAGASRERHERKATAIAKMHAGDHAAARAEFQRMIEQPASLTDAVDGRRMMAMSFRSAGETAAAGEYLAQALAALDTAPLPAETAAAMRALILMDQADLAAFGENDAAGAIRLYDAARAAAPSAKDADTAARNAAILSADLGQYGEASLRVDALLASSEAKGMPTDELLPLLSSQASWFASAGNLDEAARHYLSLWDAHHNTDNAYVAFAGAQCVAWYPPQTHCEPKIALARGVLGMVDRLRLAAAKVDASDQGLIASAEQTVATSLVNAAGCADAALVEEAQGRLRRR